MFGLSTLVSRIILGLAVALCIVGFLYVQSCQKQRQQAAESRLEREQGKAVVESAKDAIATQGQAQAREQATDQQVQESVKEIRDAKGAADPVNADVNDAGRRGLCALAAFRNDPKCINAMHGTGAARVEKAR